MSSNFGRRLAVLGFCVCLASAAPLLAPPREPPPTIHPEFPIRGRDNLSPPIVGRPIHQCAMAVFVSGAVPHAEVSVFANTTELVGKKTLWIGAGDIGLMRALNVGDVITAQQTVNGIPSGHSIQPVTVTQVAASSVGKPEVAKDLWSCGIVVPVGKLTPSSRVLVFENGQPIGSGNAAADWLPVVTQALTGGRAVRAQQVMCADDPARRIEGPLSDPPVAVQTSPNPPPAPEVIPGSVVPGKDTVDVMKLFTGAEVIVRDRGNVVSSGLFATGSANWVPIAPPADPASKIDAAQKLCSPSVFSPPVEPTTEIRTPVLLGPICDGQQFVVIKNTSLGANVVVFGTGGIVGYGGGNGGLLVLGLGRKLRANPQDHVSVRQYYSGSPPVISQLSNVVDVVGGIGTPSIEIEGGDPFFLPEPGEQAIDGPVFPRGRGPGPRFHIQTCCRDGVRAEILAPNGVEIADLTLVEEFPGYFTATWDWKSRTHWAVPDGIPAGAFGIRVSTNCRQEPATKTFYVIFDPAAVNGPPRFSFDETAIWFYSPANSDRALTYTLHPDDMRIFSKAINAVIGEPSPLSAVIKVAKAEANLFAYSVSKSDVDTLEQLQDPLAQCADDAGMLTAMLRAIGIPAHPVTADAAAETGFGWGFDTFTEFLVPGATAPEWKVVHTHWPNNATVVGLSDRTNFGNTVGVAKKSANDIVFMAGPGWVWNEVNDTEVVSFGRQACGEPNQSLNKKGWVEELCEAGYWAPTTHWACGGGTGTSSYGLSISRDPTVDFRRRSVSGEVTIQNKSGRRRSGRFRLELLADVPETKVFGDRVLGRREITLRLPPRGSATERFEFPLREGLRPGETLHLRLSSGNKALAAVEIPFEPPLRIETEREKTLRVGAAAELVVRVLNRTSYAVERVELTVDAPAEIEAGLVRGEGAPLGPGQPATFRVTLKGKAPLDAGGLVLTATSDAGGARLRIPVRVVGPSAGAEAPQPVAWPRGR
jgi:hypothetical protein